MMLNLNMLFAGFRVVNLVGSSCDYREVYEAETDEGKKVFLTVYDNKKSVPMMRDDVVREFAFLRAMPHPVFPKFICMGTYNYLDRAMSYMVTEYFEGVTLRSLVESQSLPVSAAVDIALQVMNGMRDVIGYTNGGGHYNLCPDTIVVSKEDEDYTAHLVGFDHLAGPCYGDTPFVTANMNPCCRAPETYFGRFNAASDVYSMGMLLVYMVKGHYPYWIDEVLTEQEIRDVVLSKKEPRIDLPEGLKHIVWRAISKNVRTRYMNLESMFHALREYTFENNKETPARPSSKSQECENNGADLCDDETSEEEQTEDQERDSKTPRLKIGSSVRKGEGLKAVAGMSELKQSLLCDFVDVVKHRELAARFNIRPNNILLFGPPGCGKTYISNRLAEECGMEVYSVSPSDLGSIYIHGTQSIIRDLFMKAEMKAKKTEQGVCCWLTR